MNALNPSVRPEKDVPAKAGRAAAAPDSASGGCRCVPCRQKNARDYLAGSSPGVMAFYAPEHGLPRAEAALQRDAPTADPAAEDPSAEDDETVERLREWREEAID